MINRWISHRCQGSLLFQTCLFLGSWFCFYYLTQSQKHWLSRMYSYLFPSQKQLSETNLSGKPNDHCPGLQSPDAGVNPACQGCPNQMICASTDPKKLDTGESEEIKKKFAQIKKKILILSGKGGVGKSTVCSQLAWVFQKRRYNIGLLDIDICGPSIPTMTGSRHEDVHASADGWSPVYVCDNFAVMSIGFLLPHEDDAIIWRGPKKNGIIRQFLSDVHWNDLDILLIDTPPGTSDEHLSIVSYLSPAEIDGAIIVSTPQSVALRDVRKEINFCKKVGVRILGVVENMSHSIFADFSNDAVRTMCIEMQVPYSGLIPLDRDILQACEEGKSVVDVNPQAPSVSALNQLVDALIDYLNL